MASYGWLLDIKKCIECRACESACKQWNQVEIGVGVRYREVRVTESGAFPQVQIQALTSACNHCENAWCLKVCPAKAIYRRPADGTVQIDQEKCLGCTQCAMFCPYRATKINERTRKPEKCTGCYDRIEQGMQPACATLCPTGALQWGKWEDIAGKGSASIPGFANPNQTYPHVRFITTPFAGK